MKVIYFLYILILQEGDADAVNYVALNFSTRKAKGMKKRKESPQECVYSSVTAVQHTLQEPSGSTTCMWRTHNKFMWLASNKAAWLCLHTSVDVAALYVFTNINMDHSNIKILVTTETIVYVDCFYIDLKTSQGNKKALLSI